MPGPKSGIDDGGKMFPPSPPLPCGFKAEEDGSGCKSPFFPAPPPPLPPMASIPDFDAGGALSSGPPMLLLTLLPPELSAAPSPLVVIESEFLRPMSALSSLIFGPLLPPRGREGEEERGERRERGETNGRTGAQKKKTADRRQREMGAKQKLWPRKDRSVRTPFFRPRSPLLFGSSASTPTDRKKKEPPGPVLYW